MIKAFQFAKLPRIIFRNGAISDLPGIIRSFGNRIAIVTGKSSFITSIYATNLIAQLDKLSVKYKLISIEGEPSPGIVDRAVKSLAGEDINLVVGIGGGSVLDAGKAISAMIHRSESVKDFLEIVGNKEHPGTKIPFIAVPTTSGTGSEATKNAVISQVGKDGFKRSLRHDNFVPDIALVDPQLTLNCPKDITAASGMDCFTQLLEAYISTKSNEYTDALSIEGFKAIKSSLVRSYLNGSDLEARTGMAFAALTSGICIANAGLGVVHGFASSIGGSFNIPHGIVCGTLMPSANSINVRELRASSGNEASLEKYSLLGQLFLDEKGKRDDYYIDGFIEYLYKLSDIFQLHDFKKFGIGESDIKLICSVTEIKNNPVKLTTDHLAEIVENKKV